MSIRIAGPRSFDLQDCSKSALNPKMLISAIAVGIGLATLVRCEKVGRSCTQNADCGPNAVCNLGINLCVSTIDESSSPTIATQTLREGIVGAPYDESLSASGGAGGYRWILLNAPVALAWLQLDASSGRLTGTPLAAQQPALPLTVQVRDSASHAAEKVLALSVRNCIEGESVACAVSLQSACFMGLQSCRGGILGGCVVGQPSSDFSRCGTSCSSCGQDADRCRDGVCRCGAADSCSGDTSSCCPADGGASCVDTRSNPDFCGGCGVACDSDRPNVVRTCDTGACQYPCAPNWGRCLPGARGCETDFTDIEHCGSCTNRCPVPDGGFARCEAGTCALGCSPGSQLCPPETCFPLDDLDHCGNCTQRCLRPDAGSAGCRNGQCEAACPQGYNLCGTDCVSNDDQNNCGGCGQICAIQGGTALCSQGHCNRQCPAGFNACRVDTGWQCINNDDPTHCGRCDLQCDDTQQCRAGRCVDCPICGRFLCCGTCVREEGQWVCN